MSGGQIVYLIRHPHTQVDSSVPSAERGLSNRGELQLKRLAALDLWSSVRHTYTSSEHKAACVGDLGLRSHSVPHSSHDELNELRRPWMPGDSYVSAVHEAFEHPDRAVTGWESVESGFNRVMAFLLETVASGPLPAAVVSHGLVLSAVRASMLGQQKVEFEQWQSLPFAAVAVADIENWKILSDFTTA